MTVTMMENRTNRTNDMHRVIQDIAPVLQRVVPRDEDERKAVERFFALLGIHPYRH